MEEPYKLPEGWMWATIGDACEINPKSSNLSDIDQSLSTTFVPMSAVDQIEGVIETPEVLSLGKARKGHTHFIENDIIFAKITPCMENGKVAIAKNLVNDLGFGSTEFHVIRPPKGVIPKFVFYFLRQEIFRKEASVHFTSTVGQMRVPKAFMMDALFPLPPLAEQHRIVAKLEALLAQVNAAKDHLAAVPPLIKRFRQSVLAAACSGRLTEDWRREHPDVEPASGLLKRIREERIRKYEEECQQANAEGSRKPKKPNNIEPQEVETEGLPELPRGWGWATVQTIASPNERSIQSGPFGSNLLHSEFQDTGVLAIGIDNVSNGKFSLGKEHRISLEKYEELKKYTARPYDVLITVMSTVGRCCVVPEDIETAIVTKHVYRITPDDKLTNPYFVMNCLRGCPIVIKKLFGEIKGVTRPGVNGKILKNLPIPLPPLSEQHAIVNRIETLFHRTSEVEERVAAATSHADRLTQSILAKAFRGELVPQDLADEPASVLLERIRKERTELKKKKKPQKRRSKII